MEIMILGLDCQLNLDLRMPQAHSHDEIELNFLEQGDLTYLIAGRTVTLEAQRLALFWSAIPHQVIHFSQPSRLYWLTVPLSIFLQWSLPTEFTQGLLQGEIIHDTSPIRAELDRHLFRQWQFDLKLKNAETKRTVLLEVEARLRRLSADFVQTNLKELATSSSLAQLHKVEQIAHYLAKNYQQPLLIEQVAQAVELHPKYAMRIFHKSFGMSILDYLTQYRLAHAQRLLLTTDAPILEIALDSGFGSLSRFYAVFKEKTGKSPREYRVNQY